MRRVQFFPVALDLQLQPGVERGIDEDEHHPGAQPVAAPQRVDMDVEVLAVIPAQPPLDGVEADHPVLGMGSLNQRSQLDRPV